MGFRSAFLFVILADAAVIPASAQQQLGQSCHSGLTDPLHGLYCTVIHSSFVPQQGRAYQFDNSGNLVGSCLRLIDSERSPSISL